LAITKKLAEPLPVNFEFNRLASVLDYFRNTTGVSFTVNWAALEAAGIERDMPITMQLNRVPADTAIKLVLKQVGGGDANDRAVYGVIGGAVHITTASDLRKRSAKGQLPNFKR